MRRKTQSNLDLQKIYDKVFLKGEEKHFTRKILGSGDLEFNEVLKEASWKNKNVLDVGCGIGRFLYFAAKKGAKCSSIIRLKNR